MIDLLVRYRMVAVLMLAAMVVTASVLAWWTTRDHTLISAQERMVDICASATVPESYDINVVGTTERGSGTSVGYVEYRRNANSNHSIFRREPDGDPLWEKKVFYRNAADGAGGASDSDAPDHSRDIVETTYLREFSESGEWDDWHIGSVREIPSAAATASSGASGQSGTEEEISTFCGLPLEIEGYKVEFRYVGEETLNGVRTRHFYHAFYPIPGEEDYYSKEFWFGSEGLYVQYKDVAYIAPRNGQNAERVERLHTYSGWGEPNIINTPVVPTPTATPAPATATPVPPTSAPPLPSGLTASASGTGSIALSWTALSGAAYYGVYQYFPATTELPAYWGKVAEDVPGATYTVSGLDCGTTYHYGLSAFGDGVTYKAAWSAGGFSGPVEATTDPCDGPGS